MDGSLFLAADRPAVLACSAGGINSWCGLGVRLSAACADGNGFPRSWALRTVLGEFQSGAAFRLTVTPVPEPFIAPNLLIVFRSYFFGYGKAKTGLSREKRSRLLQDTENVFASGCERCRRLESCSAHCASVKRDVKRTSHRSDLVCLTQTSAVCRAAV